MDHGALAGAIQAALPVTRGVATLACLGIEGQGDRVALELEVRLMEGDELVGTMAQTLPVASLDVADAAELVARATERLAAIEGPILSSPAQLLAPPFRPLPASEIAQADAHAIYDRLAAQAHAAGFEARFDRLDVWPREARTIYFLVVADAVLGGRGIGGFLQQAPLEEVLGVLDALEVAGCARLARLLRQGLTLVADEGGAELLMQIDDDWIADEGLPLPEGMNDWSKIDTWDEGGTWWLLREELAPARERYVRDHRAVIGR